MYCLLLAMFAAQDGATPLHPYMLHPPLPLQNMHPRPTRGRSLCSDSYPYHQESEHFTLQWEDNAIPEARIQAITQVLETAWEVLVTQQGWTPPVSSDNCYLWFVLDKNLSGSGYTTEYTTTDYPEGYPVTFLNPVFEETNYPDFALSVAAHEFGHMLQFAVEDWDVPARRWYWEASAEWLAEVAAPDIDTYALSSYWYARSPTLSYNSELNYHPYGMFLLNAWMDTSVGSQAIQAAWQEARLHPDEDWDARLARSTDQDFSTLVADFTGAYLAGALPESPLYTPPTRQDSYTTLPTMQIQTLPEYLGTMYVDFAEGGDRLIVDGPVLARYASDGQWSDQPPTTGPFSAAFTSLSAENASFSYGQNDSAADSAQDSTPHSGPHDPEPQNCGCAQSGIAPWGLVSVFLLRRRQRSPYKR